MGEEVRTFDVFNHPKASRLSDEKYASLRKKRCMELTKDTLLKIIKNRRNYNRADPFNEAIDSKVSRMEERHGEQVLKSLEKKVRRKVEEKAYSLNDIKKILKDCSVRLTSDKTYTLFMELKLLRLKERRSMTPNELQKFFGDEGIALTGPEIKSLFAAFDADNNNELSSDEFMKFAEQARTAQLNPNSDFWSSLPTLQEYLKLLKVDTTVDKAKLRLSGTSIEKLAHTNLEAEKEQKMLRRAASSFSQHYIGSLKKGE